MNGVKKNLRSVLEEEKVIYSVKNWKARDDSKEQPERVKSIKIALKKYVYRRRTDGTGYSLKNSLSDDDIELVEIIINR